MLFLIILIAACAKEPIAEKKTCKDECVEGEESCIKDNIMRCGDFDKNGCLEWSSPIKCPGSDYCYAGECIQLQCSVEEKNACEELMPGENIASANRLNLVFAGSGFDKDIVKQKALLFLFTGEPEHSAGLFKLEPFKSNKNKFNFWIIDKDFDIKSGEHGNYEDFVHAVRCCQEKKWYGYLYIDDVARSVGGMGPSEYALLFAPEHSDIVTKTTFFKESAASVNVGGAMHETGHLIGKLDDEYIEGRTHNTILYYHGTNTEKNMFYDSVLDDDGFISIQECRDNAPWKDWIGKGCGQDGVVDCIDKYVFHKQYFLWEENPSLSLPENSIQEGHLEDEYCDYGDEENCRIELNGQLINPFNPGEGFMSVVQEGDLYRQETFSHDLLCKPDDQSISGFKKCKNEVDCFVGGFYYHYNIYRSTFQSIMRGGADFGPYHEYLIEQEINRVLAE